MKEKKPDKPMQKDVKDTRNNTPNEPRGINTKNESFPNYRAPRDQMPDLKALPKTLPQNPRATTIAAMAFGDNPENTRAEGKGGTADAPDKYNAKHGETHKMPNSAFLDKSKNGRQPKNT